jgi:RNA polymerase sigma-70 factor (ECF subfamily)
VLTALTKEDNNMEENQFPTSAENGKLIKFNNVYDELYSQLRYYANQLTSNEDEAKDIVIESFEKLWKLIDRYDNIGNIRPFLYTTVRNACIDYLRRNKTRNKYYEYLLRQQDSSEISFGRPDYETELIQRLYQEIEKLPTECKKIFKLTYLEGLSRIEVASLLKISTNTVRNQNAMAKKFLRNIFKDKDLIVLLIILTSKFFKN